MARFSASDIAGANNIPRTAAAALLQYLREAELVTSVGVRAKEPGQKGRGETLYEGDNEKIVAHLHGLKMA